MSKEYDDILKELERQLKRIDSFAISGEVGKTLGKFTDKMIEIARIRLYESEQERKFAESLKVVMNELENSKIAIKVEKLEG